MSSTERLAEGFLMAVTARAEGLVAERGVTGLTEDEQLLVTIGIRAGMTATLTVAEERGLLTHRR